jgi:hypothetical protein
MAGVKMITVATFFGYTEALVAKASLQAYGVECIIPDENMIRIRGGGINRGLSLMQDGIQLQVAESDAEKAREFFANLS